MAFLRRAVVISIVCVLFSEIISGQFSRPGGNSNIPQTSLSCNYITSFGTGGTCVVTTREVERKFNLVADEISRTKLQFIAQNSILQSRLANLTKTDRNLAFQIDGIKRDLQTLRGRTQIPVITNPPTGSNTNVNQVQTALTQLINGLDRRLTSLTLQIQRDAVAAAQTDAAMQQQLTQVVRDNQQLKSTVATLTQNMNTLRQNYARDLQQLTTQIRVIAANSLPGRQTTAAPTTRPTAAPTSAPTSNVIPASVLKNIRDLNATIQSNTQAINSLNAVQSSTLKNHTAEIGDLHVDVRIVNATAQKALQLANSVYQSLQTFNGQTLFNLRNNVTTVNALLSNLQTTVKNLQSGQVNLTTSTAFLKSDLATLQTSVTQGQRKQDQAIINYANGLSTSIGGNRQIRNQLQNLQNKLKLQLSPAAIVAPPIIAPTPTSGIQQAPPTLFPPPG